MSSRPAKTTRPPQTARAYDLSPGKAEAGGLQVQGQPEVYNDTLSEGGKSYKKEILSWCKVTYIPFFIFYGF